MIPQLADKMSSWFRYVDDTFTIIKDGEIESVQKALNEFHKDINFTFETETEKKIPFLDVMISRKEDGTFDTEVYRKKTDTNIYINWEAFATRSWKIGTLKGLFRRAFLICSTEQSRRREINFLKHVFTKINGYPSRVVNDTLHHVKAEIDNEASPSEQQNNNQRETNTSATNNTVTPYICLPYKGKEGERVISKF